MTSTSIAGAVIIVAVAVAYGLWIRSRATAPMPDEPHRFDPEEGVRFLGTARVDGRVAAWPRGELVADRDVIMVAVAVGRAGTEHLVVERSRVQSVTIEGGRISRRVTLAVTGPEGVRAADTRFGAAMADPAPALRQLGWPVVTP
jgi:hypothetical protein